MSLPIVAIIGRPNVGKSTLFNRILRRPEAVVDPQPGVTRDRNYAVATWSGLSFTLVDTGGYLTVDSADQLMAAVREQTLVAAEEADLVLLVVDAQAGLSEVERDLARILHRRGTPTLTLANKVDDPTLVGLAWESLGVGLGEPLPVSGLTGYGVAEMLDEVTRALKSRRLAAEAQPAADELTLAIIGAPNTGKSSLVNRLAGRKRMVVSDKAGTTRDAVDTLIKWQGRSVRLIDTAGLRRKRSNLQGLDFYCTIRALRALDRCEVAAVVADATVGVTSGDIRLMSEAARRGVGILLALNKWDAVEKDEKTADRWMAGWRRRAAALRWVPVLFISALTGQRTIKVLEEAFGVKAQRDRRIPTSELNDALGPVLAATPPPAVKGKYIKIKYISQVQSAPPRFACFASNAALAPESYRRYVERVIRERYGFRGVPLEVVFREK